MTKFHKEFPNLGMSYEQVKHRLKKYDSVNRFGNVEMKNSLRNQLRLAEGEPSLNELDKELSSSKPTAVHSFSGAGNKQNGWGPGKKLGDGRWRRIENGTWEKVD